MKTLIQKLLREGLFDDFDFPEAKKENHGKVIKNESKYKFITMTLYRGIKNEKELIDNHNGTYTIINKHEGRDNNFIWFTNNESFALDYSEFALLTYPLEVAKHKKIITYEDGYVKEENTFIGEVESAYGRGVIDSDPTNDSPIYGNIELPPNWYFSYKAQKHIVCNKDLIIKRENLTLRDEIE